MKNVFPLHIQPLRPQLRGAVYGVAGCTSLGIDVTAVLCLAVMSRGASEAAPQAKRPKLSGDPLAHVGVVGLTAHSKAFCLRLARHHHVSVLSSGSAAAASPSPPGDVVRHNPPPLLISMSCARGLTPGLASAQDEFVRSTNTSGNGAASGDSSGDGSSRLGSQGLEGRGAVQAAHTMGDLFARLSAPRRLFLFGNESASSE
jgi:hypothetical protein